MAMKICKECGNEVSSKGVCPKCGKDQRNFFVKHKVMTFILAVLVLGIIVGATGGNNTNTSNTVATGTNIEQKTEYSQGEEARLGDGAITVTKVEKSKGDEWNKPQSGKEFVIVSVTIENKGNSNLSYNPYYFKMQNSQGQQEDVTFTTIDQDTKLQSGELISGGKVSGTITFEEPIGDTNLTLIYNDNIWSSKEVKIKLQ